MSTPPAHVRALLDQLIAQEDLHVLFQPIVALDRQSIHGYEGLVRGPEHSLLHKPNVLFAAAAKYQRLAELDFLCHKMIARQFAKLKLKGLLFLNIDPGTPSDPGFIPGQTLVYLKSYAIDPERVVIEITETRPIPEWSVCRTALQHYRQLGFRVALDDLGTGYSSLKLWSELRPDLVKLDREFIQDVDQDATKRQFIHSLLEIAKSQNCQIVAEGIEHKREYAALRQLGITLAQGRYFAAPTATPTPTLDPRLFSERAHRPATQHHRTAAALLREVPPIAPELPVRDVGELFRTQDRLHALAVVDRGQPLGIIPRDHLMNVLASRYGLDLHGRKPIREFLTQAALMFDLHTPLEDISRRLTGAEGHYTDEFILTTEGVYLGLGSLLDLLRAITDLQVHRARYANPLTLLPGNLLIQQTLDDWLGQDEPFWMAYCDLDHFKAYNDVYGYARGDELIQLTGRLLLEFSDPERDFVGHIGGDDFIVLFRSPAWRQACEQVLHTFASLVPNHYSPEDRQRGGIAASDRYGQKRQFPFVALSIGVLPIAPGCCDLSEETISAWASHAKKQAKQQEGNSLHIEDPQACPQAL